MTNSEQLERAIKKRGLKKNYIAKQLGVSAYGLFLKINNENEFKASEIQKLSFLLNLSLEEKEQIFFTE